METEFVLSLGEQQWTLQAGTDTITIGRASNADIRLQADDQISRIHARLSRDGTTWTLHDESRNGTGLNGRRLTAPTALTTGDRIHIGRSVLTFHKPTTPADTSPGESPAASPAAPPPAAPPAAPPLAASTPVAPPAPTSPAVPESATPIPEPSYAAPEPPSPPDHATPTPEPRHEPTPFHSPATDHPSQADELPAATPFADAGAYEGSAGGREYGAAGVVPGFEVGDDGGRDGGTWAAYPSADNPEPVRSPWEISAQIDQSEANWNESAGWPDPTVPGADQRARGEQRVRADEWAGDEQAAGGVRAVGRERRASGSGQRGADQASRGEDRLPEVERASGDDAVGTVRLSRVLVVAGAIVLLGIVVNLVVTFLADGPGGVLRWLVAPGIALVVAMVLALVDAARPTYHRPGRLDVSVLVAVAVVLVGVGVGGFALTAGAEYVGGYLTGNETGEDRLIKPVSKPGTGVTMTVENVTYTSHFTRVEVKLVNTSKEAITVPIDGTTFTAADGTALRADPGRSAWPSRIAPGGTEHGTLTFKGHLPDSATAAVLTFKSGSTSFAISKITLSN
ncbi:FHA domain-containing protein [Kribbella sindirgiensis]|uniref:FHA domain-containing protein n=1 Tax=Kribbella sindirgiensis TaxID=1124744 RepID=A0A4R0IPZ3_9ACTN|nr:FHA domain-containing protein [Kribbella sindirgiensis]TCC34620.1 FHA domain-containing protein [Kribbella sindirgiensis]